MDGKPRKLYQFFLVDDWITEKRYPAVDITKVRYDPATGKKCVLYAYTLDKTKAKIFEAWRDPKLFIRRDVKISEEMYSYFSNEYPTQKLLDETFTIKSYENNIVASGFQLLTVTSAESEYVLAEGTDYVYDLLRAALRNFDTSAFLAAIDPEMEYIFTQIFPLTIVNEFDYPVDVWQYGEVGLDNLNIFIQMFGNTFRDGGDVPCFGNSIDYHRTKIMKTLKNAQGSTGEWTQQGTLISNLRDL